jgi:lipoprotein NlpI
MNRFFRAVCALAALSTPVVALAADETAASAPSASASSSPPRPVPPACAQPGSDRAANHACALALARRSDAERVAGHDAAAMAAMAKADEFEPDDLRFAIALAGLTLKSRGQLSPAGIDLALKAAPDDVGLALMHGELALATKRFDVAVADATRVIARRPDDFEAATGDVDAVLRLEPKSPDALRLRAILRNSKGNHGGALADLEAAHTLQPKPEDPFLIGSTQFLQRDFKTSATTLARKPPAGAEGSYWTIWRYLALARSEGMLQASGSLGPPSAPGSPAPWPAPVIDFYLGAGDEASLLAKAAAAQQANDLSQVCEARFYLAEDALLRRRGNATALFQATVKECPRNFHEYEGAQAELAAAGGLSAAAAASVAP